MRQDSAQRAPYPGLRAFRREETDLFFGREDCVVTMVDRLAATRFLAVLGSSGTGKSSLVRTGLLDGLELGLMGKAGSRWRIVDFRPGGAPLKQLARRLLETEDPDGAAEPPAAEVDLLRAFLARGPRSIVEWCRAGHLPKGTNLLLLVDQFEELFRYQSYAGREEAEAFVALLIESAHTKDFPIYVTITMRSEYLGACSLIEGLSDAINAGMFLTPRMTRDQCHEAIVGPAQVVGIDIEPALVNRLLNDLANFAPWDDSDSHDQLDRIMRRADQLPLLQYTLNRMWLRARERAGGEAITLTLADYDAIGGLSGALNAHANQIFEELGKERWPIIEWVFRALTSGTTIADAVRRPTRFDELVVTCGGDEAGVRAVVDAFRAPGVNFLVPEFDPKRPALAGDTFIDISHESLIRQWKKLSDWLDQEARAAQQWRRLIDRYGTGELLRGRELANLIAWRAETNPNAAWAKRYGGDYEPVIAFLDKSQRAEQKQRNTRLVLRAAAAVSVLSTVGLLTYLVQNAQKERVQRELVQTQSALKDANYQIMETAAKEARERADRINQAYTQVVETVVFNITQKTKDADINSAVLVATETFALVRNRANDNPSDNDVKRLLSVTLNIFGDVKLRADDVEAAGKAFDESLAIVRKLNEADADKSLWQDDLALALVRVAQVKAKRAPALTPDNRAEVTRQLDEARALYTEALAIDRKLVAGSSVNERLLNNFQVHLGQAGDLLVRIGDLAAARDVFTERLDIRRKRLARDPDNTSLQRDVSIGLDKVGDILRRLGDFEGARKMFEEELAIDRQIAARLPNDSKSQQDLAWSLINSGDIKARANDLAEARKLYEQATEMRRKVLAADPENAPKLKDLSNVLDKVGNMARQLGDTEGARKAFDEELAIDRKLAMRDPNNTQWQRDLAWSLGRVGDLQRQAGDDAAAIKTFQEALDVERRLSARDPNSTDRKQALAAVSDKLGDAKGRANDRAGSIKAYEEALDLRRQVLARDPENAQWQKDVSNALDKVGNAMRLANRLDDAHKLFDEELAIDRKLAEQNPDNVSWQRDLAWSLGRVGDLDRQTGKLDAALKSYDELLAVERKLLARETASVDRQRALATALNKFGDVKRRLKDFAGSRAAYQEELDIRRRLFARDPANSSAERDVSTALDNLGNNLRDLGDLEGARKAFEEELAIDRHNLSRDPEGVSKLADVVWSLNKFGDLLRQLGDLQGARRNFEEAVLIDRKLALREPDSKDRHTKYSDDLTKLIGLLMDVSDVAAARDSYEELFLAGQRWADVVRRQFAAAEKEDARKDLVQVLGTTSWHALLGNRPKEAAQLAEEALKLDSSQPWIRVNLGHAYLFLGRIEEAKAIYLAVKDLKRNDAGRMYSDEIRDDFSLFRRLQFTLAELSRIERELGI